MNEQVITCAVVTGPTGAIGTALCRLLLAEGVTVYAVCRPESPRTAELPKGVHKVDCDLSELVKLPEMIPHADAFFHLGWAHTIGAGRNDMPAQIDNIRYAVDAAQAAEALGCSVFVGVGSQAEHGRLEGAVCPDTPCFPLNGYGMAKLCAGEMTRVFCREHGIRHVWTRVLSVYGPGDTKLSLVSVVLGALLKGEKPALTAGEQQWDYLYSGDAARALWSMALRGRDGAVYPLGGGQARPLKEYMQAMRDAVDPQLPLGLGELPYPQGQMMYLRADLTALTQDTGFAPQTDFAAGIRETLAWYCAKER